MNGNRVWILLGTTILVICLVLSVTALTVLRNAVDETKMVKSQAELMLGDLQTILEQKEKDIPVVAVPKEDPVDDTPKQTGFVMKSVGNDIIIYTEDGLFVRSLEIDPATLPKYDREALVNGIQKENWKEMLSLIEDFSN